MHLQKKTEFVTTFLYFTVLAVLCYFSIKYLLVPLLPFITAFIIVSSSRKITSWIEDKTHSKKTSSLIFTFTLIIIISVLVYALFYGVFTEISILSSEFDEDTLLNLKTKVSEKIQELFGSVYNNRIFNNLQKFMPSALENAEEGISTAISSFIPSLISFLMKFLSFFPSAIIFIGILFISMFYIGCDYDKICDFFAMQLSDTVKETFDEAKSTFTSTAKELFKSYFVLTFITFIQLFIGFSVIGIDYALLLSALICFIDFLPILGTGTVLIPWSAVCFIFDNYRYSIGLIVLYAVITIFRRIAEPKIVSSGIGLSPLLSLISIFLGLKLIGITGIIIFPITLMTVIRLNEKGFINLYKNFPVKTTETINKSKLKFINFKRNDK